MKYFLLSLCFLCFLSVAVSQNFPPAQGLPPVKPSVDLIDHTNKPSRIEVVFTRQMRFNDLVKIKLDLGDQGISLDYQSLAFDAQGGLAALSFRVNCNDGFSGSASNSSLAGGGTFGFYRDYSNVNNPFGAGAIASR